ncbi:MAG: hypothetical protein NC218_01890 [Acetobacter sp.]|nr:hypothetical protein [Acetobacter sp.]
MNGKWILPALIGIIPLIVAIVLFPLQYIVPAVICMVVGLVIEIIALCLYWSHDAWKL